MNKIAAFICFLTIAIFSNFQKASASHVAGADITYQHISGNSFLVTLRIFEDCSGSASVGPNETVRFKNSCGQNFTQSLPQISVIEVSQLCPSEQINSTCNGGSLPGMLQKVFQGTVELPPCADWVMSWGLCCRNTTVNLDINQSLDFVITANLNNVDAPSNSSPEFNSQPIPYVCANQLINYSFSVTEADGDSLVYVFADPFGGTPNVPVPLPWQPGFSTTQPLVGAVIDPITGIITFTPTQQGKFVLVVEVLEYNASGVLIGKVRRDIQFVVISCTNNPPDLNVGIITNLTGNAQVTGDYSLTLCEGQTFNFEATYSDLDATDTLIIVSNITQVLPGATITTSGENPLTANISWTATPGSSGLNTSFTVVVNDQSCPIPGIQTYNYQVDVSPSLVILTPDSTVLCDGDSLQLEAVGGTIFTWYDLSGVAIPVSAQFSCNGCPNPWIKPSVTTTYVVESDLASVCINRDTVTVVVAPNFNLDAVANDTTICSFQNVQFDAIVSNGGGGVYTYNWNSAIGLSDSTIHNPVAMYNAGGNYGITVEVSNAQGCTRRDTLTIYVTSQLGFNLNAYADVACVGDTGQLHLEITSFSGSLCGLASGNCGANPQLSMLGTGVNVNSPTSFPAPYGHSKKSVKQQFLYRSTELNNLGFVGGKISAIAFQNSSIFGTTPIYHNYTIKMKCTNINDLSSDFDTVGFVTVYTPKDFAVGTGWVDHVFDNSYNWNGFSNLLFEVCFDNLLDPLNVTANASSQYTPESYICSRYASNDSISMCNALIPDGNSSLLPNMRFSYCAADGNVNNFGVIWNPSANILNINTNNPQVLPGTDTLFTVSVTNQAGCTVNDSVYLHYVTSFNPQLVNLDSTYCTSDPIDTLFAYPSGGTWAGAQITPEGVFNPSNLAVGIYPVTYTVGQGTACEDSLIVHLVVGQPANTTITVPAQTTLCASAAPITLVAATAGGVWSGPGMNATTGVFNPAAAGVGTHTIIYSIAVPCASVSLLTLTVISSPAFAIPSVNTLCGNANPINLNYSPNNPNYTEVWSGTGITDATTGIFDPTIAGAGTHVITLVVSAGSCSTTQTVNITVQTAPNPTITLANLNYCATSSGAQITLIDTGGVFAGPGVSATGFFNPANATIGVNVITYTFTGACPADDTLNIVVTQNPISPTLAQVDTVCDGLTLLPGNIIGAAPAGGVIKWYADAALTNQLGVTGNTLSTSLNTGGNVYAVTELNGCVSAVTSLNVYFYPASQSSFVTDPSTPRGTVPFTVNFTHTYSGTSSFWWNFGDGDSTNVILDPTHIFADSGLFRVILTTTNSFGCSDTSGITVVSEEQLIISNVFTPNGDGKNDEFYFKIDVNAVKSFHATIFNRWGLKMVEFTSVKDKWNGENHPAGIYYYVIDAIDANGQPFKPASGYFQMIK